MSFVGPGYVVTYLVWMQQVQQLGLGDTETPGYKQTRLFEESGEFNLKIYNGGWVKCNRDADLLNGYDESSYRNAANLTGNVARGRLTLLSRDASGYISNPFFQVGTTTCTTANTWYTVTFPLTYTAGTTPYIGHGSYVNSTAAVCIKIRNISTSGFQITSNLNNTIAHWHALGERA
jgi:hypothetical protein